MKSGINTPIKGSIPACAGEAGAGAGGAGRNSVYPRVCGGSVLIRVSANHREGLSPRVRGKRIFTAIGATPRRSIPACAGEASIRNSVSGGKPVYPRVCGGSRHYSRTSWICWGLSPRVRGKRERATATAGRCRSIPACAGEASARPSTHPRRRVYPRVCGGSPTASSTARRTKGLSPRVRGKLQSATRYRAASRSIPACAGEAPDVIG